MNTFTCKQCKMEKDISEASKSGYQRKTGQAKNGLCKRCNNANLLAYKHIKNNSNGVAQILTGYKLLVVNIHNGVIPMLLPKYLRDALTSRYPELKVEERKKEVKDSSRECDDVFSYLRNLSAPDVAAIPSTASDYGFYTKFKKLMSEATDIAGAINTAEQCLSVVKKNPKEAEIIFVHKQELDEAIEALEEAMYAGSDVAIEVAGFMFTLEMIDEQATCECPDAGDCFCDTIHNFITVMKKVLKECQ